MSAAAMADDPDLLEARRKAVDQALTKLRAALGHDPGEVTSKIDSVQLVDGKFRAFVRMTAGMGR